MGQVVRCARQTKNLTELSAAGDLDVPLGHIQK